MSMDPDAKEKAAVVFRAAPFIADIDARLVDVGEGWVESAIEVVDRLRQQHGFAHAGVVATLADHTAGAAASTTIGASQSVVTADFSINLLRPAAGDQLTCRAEVVRAGRTLIVTSADVWADGKHCARYTGTMAVVERPIG